MAKVIRIHRHGGPDVLQLDELPDPAPGPGEVVARVAAAGINFFDTQLRSGLFRRGGLPLALGNEGAGTIEAVGRDVSDFHEGETVAWIMAPGSYATHVTVPGERLVRLPAGVGPEAAAAVLFQGCTAHYLARASYPLGPGKVCLVHSAAGGVGLLLCQIAKLAGAQVIGVVSTEAKAAAARTAGADHVLFYTQDIAAEAKRITAGRGVDVAYDAVGKDSFVQSLDSLRPRGCLALYGEASGLVPPFDVRELLIRGSLSLMRTGLEHHLANRAEFLERTGDVLRWVAEGKLAPHIDSRFPLAEAARAHRAIESRATIGKVLLIP
jgi:NADPH:quinone reductase